MKNFKMDVLFVDEAGETGFVGTITLKAKNLKEAREKALDELWDPRLEAASCSPLVMLR